MDALEPAAPHDAPGGADARFRALADNLPDVVARFDRELRHVFVNRAVLRATGLGPDAFLGRTHHQIPAVPPDAAARWREALGAVFATGAGRDFEFSWPTPAGLRWFEARLVPESGEDGAVRTVLAVGRDVTRARAAAAERAAAESARREGERRLTTLLSNLPGMAYRCRNAPDWPMEFVSAGARALTGYAPDDLTGGRVAYGDLILAEDRGAVWDTVQAALAREGAFHIRYRLRAADGRVRWVSEQGRGVPDARGRVAAIEGFAQDVTTVVHAEAALREQGTRLRRLVEALPVGAVYVEGERLEINPAVERLTGYTRDDVPTVDAWFRALYGEHAAAARAAYEADRAHGLGQTRPLAVRCKDGTTRVIEFGGVAGAAAGGDYAVWVLQDVTARAAAEAALRASEAKFRAVFERSVVGMMLYPVHGGPAEVNAAAGRILGYGADELVGLPAAAYSRPEDMVADQALFDELVAGRRESYQLEKRFHHREGRELWGELTVSLVRDEDGRPWFAVGMLEDVTVRKEAEARLRQAQKMEAVGQLAGGVAHDFNNLLTVIGGTASFLGQSLPPDAPEQQDVEEIGRAVGRGTALTRQLLAFSRRGPLAPRVVDARGTVAGIERMLRRAVGERAALVVRAEGEPCWVRTDPASLEQVVVNLALNARDALPEGGTVAIEVAEVADPATHAPLPAAPDDATALVGVPGAGPHVVVRVSDDGTGMTTEVLRRAFEPFFTTKEVGRGTGLGLSVVHGIVVQSGGFVRARSGTGRGTTMEVFLPRCAAPPGTAPAGRAAEPPAAARGADGVRATVLVVDDEAAVRAIVRRGLEAAGYRVLEADDGAAALRLWRERDREVDLVLTDVVMPELGGPALARAIRAEWADAPIVFMSGYEGAAGAASLPAGAPLVAKPFEMATLLAAVRTGLDARAARRTPAPG